MRREFIPYMGYQWLQIEDDSVIIGVSEEGLEDISEITGLTMPNENDTVSADEVCGEVETDEGSLNIYSPIDGKVVEVNGTVLENPELIEEDPTGDGWLIRIEATNPSDLEELDKASSGGD